MSRRRGPGRSPGTLELPAGLIPEAVRRRHRRRPALTIAEWAERYRLVCDGPLVGNAEAICWRNSVFPPGVQVMDAARRFRRVILMAAPQSSGKTALMINVLLYGLHWLNRDVMYVHANSVGAEAQYARKIAPAISRQPELAALIPISRDDIGTKEAHRFVNGTMFRVTGSESEADLSGPTVPIIACDDVHAMPDNLGIHGHAAEFAEHRSAAFPIDERMFLAAGQASDVRNWLWRQLVHSAFYVLYVPCLGCGTYQILDWDRFVYDSSDPQAAGKDCWMKCANPVCKHQIRHEELPRMLARGVWVSTPEGCDPVHGPGERTGLVSLENEAVYPRTARPCRDAGFWWNAFYWPLVPWTAHATDWVTAQADPDSIRTWRQQRRVIPEPEPEPAGDAIEIADVTSHRVAGHRWTTVPAEAGVHQQKGCVVLSADIQAGYLWYLAECWNRESGTCWVIECGRFGRMIRSDEVADRQSRLACWRSLVFKALEDLWAKDNRGWPIVSDKGEELGHSSAHLVLVDCSFLREIVQNACKLRNGGSWTGKWIPVEGSQAAAKAPVPIWPGLNRPTLERKTRRRYWISNTNRAKLYVRNLLAVPPNEAGSIKLPEDMPDYLRDVFAKHLCSEEWDERRGTWKQVSGENHLLDCQAMQIAGAIACGISLQGHQSDAEPAGAQQPADTAFAGRPVVHNWFSRMRRS
jgi:phage terminase large subunit GpA-like protein